MSDSELAQARVRQLIVLTKRLTDRLSAETQAFADRRPQDVAAGLAETQEMANLYRRDTAHVKANPALLRDAPLDDRKALVEATRVFDTVLNAHARAVEAARQISEGLVRTIAAEVTAARTPPSAYAADGRAALGDGRAVAFNRMA
ncbi:MULTISPECIES: flagellar basal-body protein FlbY [unclassified Brevundimonas]|uniref:flagellar basal-body protein FlbY n=1 Tax=unclassified Brevundimonas TaxID=2622653 RepID=UPI000E90126C|nr:MULTISPECIES: flagellar basal-body protein FlbY [unclassified Brevundimonas]MCK6104620.1 flagellar basal-body protein FlbY [Brevundimonas sp. EYE_349]HBI20120.1 flagellar basal-body protein FlbY [Brevundimonas sp.]